MADLHATAEAQRPSDERIEEWVAGANAIFADSLPAGHKLWKSWAYDLADQVLALARLFATTDDALAAALAREERLREALEEVRPLLGSCDCTHPAYGLCGTCNAKNIIDSALASAPASVSSVSDQADKR